MNKKVTGIVSYITIIGWIIAFLAGDKEGAKFHLNQSLVINLASLINGWVLGRILGIFLDNAIEAEREEEDKNIDVLFLKMNNDKYIIIENTCKNKDIDLEKIYTKEFSTKKGNTGLGLWEERNIVNKIEEMSLNTVIENERFKHILKVS